MKVTPGSTDVSVVIRIVDSTDGTPEEGVVAATAGLALWYWRQGGTVTGLTESDLAAIDSAHSDGGMKHADDGYYRVDAPDAAYAAGAAWVIIGGVATGMVVIGLQVDLETVQTGDSFARIGTAGASLTGITTVGAVAGAVGSVAGNVDGSVGSVVGAVGSVTGAVGSVTGAVGSVIGNVGGNVTGSVGSLATGTPPTVTQIQTELEENGASLLDTIMDAVTSGTYGLSALQTLLTGLNDLASGDVETAVQAVVEMNHLDHLFAADYDPASKPGTATALLNELIGNDGGVSQFTTNALELGPDSDTTTGLTLDAAYEAAKTAAQAGDLMGLADDAITSAKYDESTAFPVASADTGATRIARVGADSDTLETLSDQVDTLENRLTTARAGYLDELAAANIPADVDTLHTRLTAARAGYLDELGSSNVPADIDTLITRLTAARAGYLDELAAANIPADVDAILDDTGTDGVVVASINTGLDTYQAKVWMFDDDGGTTDRYVAVWHKNGEPITSGITSPTLQVIKASNGTDLIASDDMTQIGALGMYRYDEATNRIVAGTAYIAKVQATIGGSTRTWYQPVGRDSEA